MPRVAQFMAQLSDSQIEKMESYLMQKESATQAGDQATLAQLDSTFENELTAVADYLIQLDDTELAQLTTQIQENETQLAQNKKGVGKRNY